MASAPGKTSHYNLSFTCDLRDNTKVLAIKCRVKEKHLGNGTGHLIDTEKLTVILLELGGERVSSVGTERIDSHSLFSVNAIITSQMSPQFMEAVLTAMGGKDVSFDPVKHHESDESGHIEIVNYAKEYYRANSLSCVELSVERMRTNSNSLEITAFPYYVPKKEMLFVACSIKLSLGEELKGRVKRVDINLGMSCLQVETRKSVGTVEPGKIFITDYTSEEEERDGVQYLDVTAGEVGPLGQGSVKAGITMEKTRERYNYIIEQDAAAKADNKAGICIKVHQRDTIILSRVVCFAFHLRGCVFKEHEFSVPVLLSSTIYFCQGILSPHLLCAEKVATSKDLRHGKSERLMMTPKQSLLLFSLSSTHLTSRRRVVLGGIIGAPVCDGASVAKGLMNLCDSHDQLVPALSPYLRRCEFVNCIDHRDTARNFSFVDTTGYFFRAKSKHDQRLLAKFCEGLADGTKLSVNMNVDDISAISVSNKVTHILLTIRVVDILVPERTAQDEISIRPRESTPSPPICTSTHSGVDAHIDGEAVQVPGLFQGGGEIESKFKIDLSAVDRFLELYTLVCLTLKNSLELDTFQDAQCRVFVLVTHMGMLRNPAHLKCDLVRAAADIRELLASRLTVVPDDNVSDERAVAEMDKGEMGRVEKSEGEKTEAAKKGKDMEVRVENAEKADVQKQSWKRMTRKRELQLPHECIFFSGLDCTYDIGQASYHDEQIKRFISAVPPYVDYSRVRPENILLRDLDAYLRVMQNYFPLVLPEDIQGRRQDYVENMIDTFMKLEQVEALKRLGRVESNPTRKFSLHLSLNCCMKSSCGHTQYLPYEMLGYKDDPFKLLMQPILGLK